MGKMHWVVQENVANEDRYDEVVSTLSRFGIPYTQVKVVPFAHTLEPDVNPKGRVMTLGSITLTSRIVERKGWKPGAYSNDNFDFEVWSKIPQWAPHILNADAIVCPFRDVPDTWDRFFIRPTLDTKAFAGTVMDQAEYQTWRGRLLIEEGASDLMFDIYEMVCVAPVKEIYREFRFFIVEGKISTASVYKIGGDVTYQDEGFIDHDVTYFVGGLVSTGGMIYPDGWEPARAFVMDVAMVEDGYKIIEINCINSAGFYKANVSKLILDLNDMGR